MSCHSKNGKHLFFDCGDAFLESAGSTEAGTACLFPGVFPAGSSGGYASGKADRVSGKMSDADSSEFDCDYFCVLCSAPGRTSGQRPMALMDRLP